MKNKETFFIKQLKKIMIDKNLNQKSLGKLIGVNQQMISRWLTGSYNPAFSSIQKLAKALNVPVNYLMEDRNNASKENENITDINKDILLQLKDHEIRLLKLENEMLRNKMENK